MDSIKFYENGSWFQSARPKDDTIGISFWPETISGNWRFVSTAKISRDDSASDCIALRIIPYANGQGFYDYLLVDWHRIKGSRYGKATGNLNKPFISTRLGDGGIDWERHLVWQVPRKPKKH